MGAHICLQMNKFFLRGSRNWAIANSIRKAGSSIKLTNLVLMACMVLFFYMSCCFPSSTILTKINHNKILPALCAQGKCSTSKVNVAFLKGYNILHNTLRSYQSLSLNSQFLKLSSSFSSLALPLAPLSTYHVVNSTIACLKTRIRYIIP